MSGDEEVYRHEVRTEEGTRALDRLLDAAKRYTNQLCSDGMTPTRWDIEEAFIAGWKLGKESDAN
jgi:hypothetical protein